MTRVRHRAGEEIDADVLAAALRVAGHIDLPTCLGALAEEASALLGGNAVFCYRYSGSGRDLELAAEGGGGDGVSAPRRLDARLLDQEAPLEGCRFEDGGPLRSELPVPVLVLPVSSEGERSALLVAPGAPDGQGFRRVGDLLRVSGRAVANAIRVADLKDLMVRDDTADCYNRRYFDEYLTGEVARAVRFEKRLALIFLDMDNLKEINTRHGHSAGSRVLFEASRRINRSIRGIDTLFRFGGDEFCILLPETGAEGALEVAERVRRAIASQRFLTSLDGGETLTASLGVAAFPDHGSSAEALLEAADGAMRRIKSARKNAIGTPDDGPESR